MEDRPALHPASRTITGIAALSLYAYLFVWLTPFRGVNQTSGGEHPKKVVLTGLTLTPNTLQ